ncbi:MAG: SRPBCC domain-containing protein [Armatimonadota bacterium]
MKAKARRKGRTIETETRTRATPEQALAAFADAERVKDWWVDKVEGQAKLGAEMVWTWENIALSSPVKIVESVPGERLVLEWQEQPGVVIWEIDVAREGGETVVRIVASGFGDGAAWDELYEGMKRGQPGLMRMLKHYLDHHFGQRRRVVSVMRETSRPADTSRFLTEPHLTRWLVREAKLGRPGESARLVLRSGRELTGIVNTTAEGVLDMSCDQVSGSVFFMCYQQRVWAIISGWKLLEADARALGKELGGALDALVALT